MSDHVNGYRKTNGRRGFAMKILKRAWIPVVIVVVVAAGGGSPSRGCTKFSALGNRLRLPVATLKTSWRSIPST